MMANSPQNSEQDPGNQNPPGWWYRTGLLVAAATVTGLLVMVLVVYLFVQAGRPRPDQGGEPTYELTALARSTFLPVPSQEPTAQPTLSVSASLTETPGSSGLSAYPPDCTNLGTAWGREKDGMQMICIPAGAFIMGLNCDFKGCEGEVPRHSVNLPAFWIDQTEVTNAMFARFVDETGYISGAERAGASEVLGLPKPVPGADWRHPQGPDSSISGLENHPVVQINWFGADTYCKWAGGHLPSEAMWEKAARGGDGRLFPWGSEMPDETRLNFADLSLGDPHSSKTIDDRYKYTAPVGSYPAGTSSYGVLDLAGNAWEWTRTLYKPYPYTLSDGRDLGIIAPDGKVVLRGGSWYDDLGSVRSSLRYNGLAQVSHDATGFRCTFP